jgi:hypothetical protein
MTRNLRLTFVLGTIAVLAVACGGKPAASELTDPTAILQAAATTTAAAKTVHLDVTADGALNLDLMGTGSGTPLQLTGSTATGDVDLKGGDARVTFALPGILGLRGELIAVDGTGYLKTSLTGPQYRSMALGGGAVALPSGSPDTASMLSALSTFLAKPELAPTKGADVECGGTTCYAITISLTPEEIAALSKDTGSIALPSALPVPMPDLGDLGVDLTIQVEKDTTRLAGVKAVVGSGTPAASGSPNAGDMTVNVAFSKWDETVTITAPPADQVAPAS